MTIRRYLPISALLAAFLVAPTAQAQSILEEWYIGAGATRWSYDEPDIPRHEAWGGRLMGGVMFTRFLGLEAHLGKGGEQQVDQFTVELDQLDSLLVRLNAPLLQSLHIYALGGFSQTQVVVRSDDTDATVETGSGLSLGAGVELRPTDGFAIAIDAIRYNDEPGFEYQAATASVKWRF